MDNDTADRLKGAAVLGEALWRNLVMLARMDPSKADFPRVLAGTRRLAEATASRLSDLEVDLVKNQESRLASREAGLSTME